MQHFQIHQGLTVQSGQEFKPTTKAAPTMEQAELFEHCRSISTPMIYKAIKYDSDGIKKKGRHQISYRMCSFCQQESPFEHHKH
jgi:hypothetical protein